jgi:hypothetical protein
MAVLAERVSYVLLAGTELPRALKEGAERPGRDAREQSGGQRWTNAGYGIQPSARLIRTLDEFLERIGGQLENIRPVNAQEGTRAVFQLSRHPDRGLTVKVRDALPEDIRRKLWPENFWRRREPSAGSSRANPYWATLNVAASSNAAAGRGLVLNFSSLWVDAVPGRLNRPSRSLGSF